MNAGFGGDKFRGLNGIHTCGELVVVFGSSTRLVLEVRMAARYSMMKCKLKYDTPVVSRSRFGQRVVGALEAVFKLSSVSQL